MLSRHEEEPANMTSETESTLDDGNTLDGDVNFNEALNYLEKRYANNAYAGWGAAEDGDSEANQALLDSIIKARNGEPDARESILQFIANEQERMANSKDDAAAAHDIGDLEKVRIAVGVQNERDFYNANSEKHQQIRAQEINEAVAEQQQNNAIDARAEIYTSVYPPSKNDFNNEAMKLAGMYGANWQKLTGGVDFAELANDNPDRATAAFLMIKNAYEHNAPFDKFEQDYNNLMRKATDTDHSVPASATQQDFKLAA
jgi:hypothetical protein